MTEAKWADIEADEDFMSLPNLEIAPGKDGIKKVITYVRQQDKTIKVIRRVKVNRKIVRTNRAVYNRRSLIPFGMTSDMASGPPTGSLEEVLIEVPKGTNTLFKEREDDDFFQFTDTQLARERKELRQKFKALKECSEDTEVVKGSDDRSGKYVHPCTKMDDKYRDQQAKDECTVRVTNLCEDVDEQGLSALFHKIGKVSRIYLAKHKMRYKEAQGSKGFAFITYVSQTDAQNAVKQLNGHGFDNLLLNVEFAKPANRER